MILHRTSSPKTRNSLSFLTSAEQQTALLAQLEKQSWINEVFNRPLPIPQDYPTRFGPPGFKKNIFYASERRDTTFFEFGYGLLKSHSLLGRGISAVCFEVRFQGKQKPLDVKITKATREILDPKSYTGAHRWILEQSPLPESVRYPSVRDPSKQGINLAIFNPSAVASTLAEIESLVLTPRKDGRIEIESLTRGPLPPIIPIR